VTVGFPEVDRLVNQVGRWTPRRWAASGAAPAVHALVQHIADLAADAEGQPRRPVPRLDNDLALPDQLRVVSADLLAAAPTEAVLAEAVREVARVRRTLHG
jgi:hypothetical protein